MADEKQAPGAAAPVTEEPAAPVAGTTAAPPAAPKDPPAPAAGDKQDGQAAAPKGAGFLADATKEEPKDGKEEKPADPKGAAAYELAIPEGVKAEPALLKGFTAKAVELGIPKEQAQALVDSYVAGYLELNKTAEVEAAKRAVDNRKALEAHPDIGGQKLQQSQAEARRAIVDLDQRHNGLGSRLAQKFAQAGFGDDPDVAHLLVHYGRGIKEDRSTGATPASGTSNGPSREELRLAKMFPTVKGIQVPGT